MWKQTYKNVTILCHYEYDNRVEIVIDAMNDEDRENILYLMAHKGLLDINWMNKKEPSVPALSLRNKEELFFDKDGTSDVWTVWHKYE